MKLTPEWIVGFVDGDGHFGWTKTPRRFYFVVSQDKRSIDVLYALKTFFNCGSVHKAGGNMYEYKVSSLSHLLTIIIPFFQKYSLRTTKRISFQQWQQELQPPSVCTEKRLSNAVLKTPTSNLTTDWLLGFIDAEGCFVCCLVDRRFIAQIILGVASKDAFVLDAIQEFLGFGVRYARKDGTAIFQLSSQKANYTFVTEYLFTNANRDRLRTAKRHQARKWGKLVIMLYEKKYSTYFGWEQVHNQYTKFKNMVEKTKKLHRNNNFS